MKAAVYQRYGSPDVLQIAEVAPPTLHVDQADRVLINVQYASVNPFDYLHRQGFLPVWPSHGWLKPKTPILGIDKEKSNQ